MDLWIRSQDKMNLVKVNQVCINYQNNTEIISNYIPDFVGTQGEYYEKLGTYKTKERVLEILDEINSIKYYKYMASLDWVSFVNSIMKNLDEENKKLLLSKMNTYEMPKD